MKTNRTLKVAVGQSEKVERHQVVCMIIEKAPPSMGRWGAMTNIYLETAAWEMEMPSFASSPCTRGAPQRGWPCSCSESAHVFPGATLGPSGPTPSLFQVQYRLNPQRCQRMTVSGFTMTRTLSQSVQILRNSTQNPWSTFESCGRFTERRRTGEAAAEERHSREPARDEP